MSQENQPPTDSEVVYYRVRTQSLMFEDHVYHRGDLIPRSLALDTIASTGLIELEGKDGVAQVHPRKRKRGIRRLLQVFKRSHR